MKNALVFEPNPVYLRSITAALKDMQCSVSGFSTLKKAKDYIKISLPDIVLLRLPDGLNTRYLRTFKEIAPVIGIIVKEKKDIVKKAFKAGIEDFLLLPFNSTELKLKVECCLQKSYCIDELEREKRQLQAIVEITSLVSSTLDPHEILHFIVRKIAEVIPVVRCSMIRVDPEDKYAHVVATFEDPAFKSITLDLKKYPEIRKALSIKKPVIISDVRKDPIMREVRDIIFPLGIKSIVVLPIFYKDDIIGTLFLRTSRKGRSFTKEEIMFCSTVANASANSLYNAFMYEKSENEKIHLGRLAITDYLTGLYNIRYFYKRLDEEFSRARRYKSTLACLMMDIDLFKRINDAFGHRTGDIVLKEFAQVLRRNIRKSDILARYGGEEFIMLLPNTSEKGMLSEAERLSLSVKKHRFKSLKGKQTISVSVGAAIYPQGNIKTADDLITSADNALFEAKDKGRARVAVHP